MSDAVCSVIDLVLGPPRRAGESLTLRLERLLYRWAYRLHRLHPERRHRLMKRSDARKRSEPLYVQLAPQPMYRPK